VAGRRFPILAAATAVAAIAVGATASAAAPAPGLDALLAPTSACPHQTETQAPAGVQLRAMRCMTDYARERRGLRALGDTRPLDRAGTHKSADILRCDEFSHEACGREFTYWMRHFGYTKGGCWRAGENIAWGNGPLGSVRAIFRAWLHSPGHRENILGQYTQLGLGFRVGTLEGNRGAHVWTQEFGSHTC
jgi:uncharacterized protein YkwD